MRTGFSGVDLIKKHEGLRLQAYKCPTGHWTIGYGHRGDVEPGMSITEHQAEAILDVDLDKFEQVVSNLVKVPLTQNEFDALVALTFNIGSDAFRTSTLLKLLNANDRKGAAAEFLKWRLGTVGGEKKVVPGLVRRRADERRLFLTPTG